MIKKLKKNITYIGFFILLTLNIIALRQIYLLQKQMEFNYRWMIIKNIRAELIEKRLDQLEKSTKAAPDENKLSLDILGFYEEINELTVRDGILKKK